MLYPALFLKEYILKPLFFFTLLLLLASCSDDKPLPTIKNAIAGIKLIETVSIDNDKTVIPYHKYVLANGLTLILHEDHSDPLIHVDVTYHVGSAREELGKSGFAHFFEHMMFQGSEHVADEQHFKLVTEAGGSMNGTTNSDRTNYYQTVPANQLEKVLWLESDRMGFLLDAVTQEKFEIQRETVKNEREQSYENRPYGLLNERVSEALYPFGHPYSWQTIGYVDDLNRVNVNDLKAFFLRWYGPNNATLTIGGDIDIDKTLSLVKKYFGEIPQGPEVNLPTAPAVTLTENRYIDMEDNVHLPLLYISYPTVKLRHDDEAPLDLLSTILGGSKTSLLYKNLMKNKIAVQASASHPCAELACTFNFYALPNPASGKSLAEIEKIIRASFDEFEERGVEEDDLIKAKAEMETGFVFGLQSVKGKVSQLASNQTFTNDPNYIEKDIARYANVTRDDVMRVYKKYLKGKYSVIMSVVPEGRLDMVAAPSNYTPERRNYTQASTTSEKDLDMRQTPKTFDRSLIPASPENRVVGLPTTWQHSLANGIKILATQSIETPTTSLLINVPAGHYYETPDKAGLSVLLARMLNESTLKRSGESVSKALQMLGSSVSISASNQYIHIYINVLTKHLAATLDIVQEKVLQPAFHPTEFDRIKENAIQAVTNPQKDAGYLAATAYRQILHGDDITSTGRQGTQATLQAISLEDIKAFYEKYFKAEGTQVIAVSNLDKMSLLAGMSILEPWQGKTTPLKLNVKLPEIKKHVIYLVDKPKAAQSTIRIGMRALPYDVSGEFYRASLMNFALGGAFNSRINLNLREDKGYTYGARSEFSGNKFFGTFTASAEVRANVTDKSIIEFMSELNNYAEHGITQTELNFMRSAINQKDALKYETPAEKLGFMSKILEHDLSPSFVAERAKIVDDISPSEINALAKKYLNTQEMIIVVVGDAAILKPQLSTLDYEVIDYTIH